MGKSFVVRQLAELDFDNLAEVKAGKTGTLRSLHQFMVTHDSPMAVRLNLDLPSLVQAEGRLPTGQEYSYPLLSLPIYLVEQVDRLVQERLRR